ncbi:uncharacterized protein [Diadema antillarum]|uniref:uncharacterized protein n=1 Tax=Diadema antillarum TaxID=105358 RepID=UPI003A88435A
MAVSAQCFATSKTLPLEKEDDDCDDELVLKPEEWEADESRQICVCGCPSTEDIIPCNGPECPIMWYHRQCVANAPPPPPAGGLPPQQAVTSTSASGSGMTTTTRFVCEFCERLSARAGPLAVGDSKSTSSSKRPMASKSKSSSVASVSDASGEKRGSHISKAIFGTPRKSEEEILSQAHIMGKNAVSQIISDGFYEDTKLGREVQQLAKEVNVESKDFEEGMTAIVRDLLEIVASAQNKSVGPVANTHILTTYHKFRTKTQINDLFAKIAHGRDFCISYFQQYVLRSLLRNILIVYRGDTDESDIIPELSEHDEQVLRYVAGYVPHALFKKYSKMKSPESEHIAAVLQQWRTEEDEYTEAESFLQYSSVWLTIQNRGGLFVVSDKVYLLFHAIEGVTRKHLDVSSMQGALKTCITENIYGSESVQRRWTGMDLDLSSREADALFQTIVNYWVKIRVSAYVRTYMNIRRRKAGKARLGKKALRKELQKNRKEISSGK